jgi:hypothetical protein
VLKKYCLLSSQEEPTVNLITVKFKKESNPQETTFLSKYDLEILRGGGNEARKIFSFAKEIVTEIFGEGNDLLKIDNFLQTIYDKTFTISKKKK